MIIDRVPFAENFDGSGKGSRRSHLLAFGLAYPFGGIEDEAATYHHGSREFDPIG
ncbi:hypothetical protein [Neorhizobium sp. LjRoot104]|uniref:hypothetical protein n=1 Tax=Neorhizobium sp. LjRoot104 TaxID=3342254 RepID=UPI003ECD8BBB